MANGENLYQQNMANGENLYQQHYQPMKHSGIGIASFMISIVSGLFLFLLVAIAGIIEATTPGGIDEESPVEIVLGLGIILGFGLNLVGIGLGIAGVIQKNRKRTFAVLGLVFNLGIIILHIAIVAFGIMILIALR